MMIETALHVYSAQLLLTYCDLFMCVQLLSDSMQTIIGFEMLLVKMKCPRFEPQSCSQIQKSSIDLLYPVFAAVSVLMGTALFVNDLSPEDSLFLCQIYTWKEARDCIIAVLCDVELTIMLYECS